MSEKYFDLTIDGFGYLNNIREIPRNNKDNLWCCTIAALRGSVENADYTYFECIAAGEKVVRLLSQIKSNSEAKQRILTGFVLGGLRAKPFVFESGKHKGQAGAQLNANLIHIKWIKIGGVDIYKAKPKTDSEKANDQQPPSNPVPESLEGELG
ncbi:MAG TPA: DUF3577 domain-containing protein [Crenotrichaceae bacterium]|nr:DUF3577 domain-containing protein [Crenotrichaceae bacterium]